MHRFLQLVQEVPPKIGVGFSTMCEHKFWKLSFKIVPLNIVPPLRSTPPNLVSVHWFAHGETSFGCVMVALPDLSFSAFALFLYRSFNRANGDAAAIGSTP